jgi:2,3-bisphosphoglycerate-dependent phosphoglycerate mutase
MGSVKSVSDLQCPARFLVARHGEATYAHPELLSDEGGWLTDRGQAQARALGKRVAAERVAAVYSSTLRRAAETAELAASALGLVARQIEGVQEFSVGSLAGRPHSDPTARRVFLGWLDGELGVAMPGAETGEEVVARFAAALDELADQHRGEAVLLVSHGGVMSLAVPRIAANVPNALSRDCLLDNCATVAVDVDSDGWRVVGEWPGRPWVGSGGADAALEEARPDVVDAS